MSAASASSPGLARAVAAALLAQLLSGAAAVVNQTVWQRSLIVHLAGSEAVSSMIVVMVFMAGLGAGALWVGRSAARIRNPARAMAGVELLLAVANVVVLLLLSLEAGEVMQRLHRLAFAAGLPSRLLYALVSSALLLGPCFLMGATSPLMSEVAQRQLDRRDSRFLAVLFFVNTVGAFGGGLATGFVLMPLLGQAGSLVLAIGLNALAAVLVFFGCARRRAQLPEQAGGEAAAGAPPGGSVRGRLLALAFAMGLLALAYEMYLYRVVALSFEPKPYTFATVLCFYLLTWSVGVLLARWIRWALPVTLAATAAATLLAPWLAGYPWPTPLDVRSAVWAAGFWLPCLGFGAAFGQLVIRLAVHWGSDVGRFYGWNTIGSCVGIVAGVLIGYRYHPTYMILAIALGYLAVTLLARAEEPGGAAARMPRALLLASATALGLWVSALGGLLLDLREQRAAGSRTYFGPEGVLEIRHGRAVYWNGLGHATLSRNDDHVGDHNWAQAVMPLLAHGRGRDLDALVVGLGSGITVGTLARSESVRSVDVYEINPELRRVLADYPEGTLGVGTSDKVHFHWEDGRTGLALSDRRYDLVTQAPLYLKQAGCSILLSREYMQLVRRRLKPGGVYAIYSNAQGHAGQALVVRQTAAQVFAFGESFRNGYLLVVSDAPLEVDAARVARFLAGAAPGDRVAREIEAVGMASVAAWLDRPRLPWSGSPVVVTDDHPVVEYPDLVDWLVERHRTRAGAASPAGP